MCGYPERRRKAFRKNPAAGDWKVRSVARSWSSILVAGGSVLAQGKAMSLAGCTAWQESVTHRLEQEVVVSYHYVLDSSCLLNAAFSKDYAPIHLLH